jgi:hypothetical protein
MKCYHLWLVHCHYSIFLSGSPCGYLVSKTVPNTRNLTTLWWVITFKLFNHCPVFASPTDSFCSFCYFRIEGWKDGFFLHIFLKCFLQFMNGKTCSKAKLRNVLISSVVEHLSNCCSECKCCWSCQNWNVGTADQDISVTFLRRESIRDLMCIWSVWSMFLFSLAFIWCQCKEGIEIGWSIDSTSCFELRFWFFKWFRICIFSNWDEWQLNEILQQKQLQSVVFQIYWEVEICSSTEFKYTILSVIARQT